MKNITYIIALFLSLLILTAGCSDNNQKKKHNSVNSLKQYEDSLDRARTKIRREVDKQMIGNKSVFGDIKLGQSEKEYKEAVRKIKKSIGYEGLSIQGFKFKLVSPEFYKGKLLSVKLKYNVQYLEGESIGEEKLSRADLIIYFFEKFGKPDYFSNNRDNISFYYKFCDKKFDFRLSDDNLVKKTRPKYTYERNIIITYEDPSLIKLKEKEEYEIKQQEQADKVRKEQKQKQKEQDLLKTL